MNKKITNRCPLPIQGWYSENSAKLQRGGKTSGLTCLDNCLINSGIDFHLLLSQFKDIQLQLHATKVTNPYTFSIQGNKSFSGRCVLSNVDTALFNGTVNITSNLTITIPNGVKVLRVNVNYGDLVNKNSNKCWSLTLFDDNNMSYSTYTNYVGVTPGKTYTLSPSSWYYQFHNSISVKIYYSASINNSKARINDY